MHGYHSDLQLRICGAEDLIIMKAFADRERDGVDVEGIVVRHGVRLDWTYIETQLGPLTEARESPEILLRLASLRRKQV